MIQAYLDACGYAPDELISIGTRAKGDGQIFFTVIPVADAARQIAARKGVNCWISANPIRRPEKGRGSAEDVTRLVGLWADLDLKGGLTTYAQLRAITDEVSELIGAEPVAIVASGHGLQPRWTFEGGGFTTGAADVLERFGRLVQMVAERHGGAVDNVYDLPRVLRAPGTTNIKGEQPPVEVKLKLTGTPQRVDRLGLEDVLDRYAPHRPSTAAESGEVPDASRGNAYTKGALVEIKRELTSIADWPSGKTDERGRGWEKIQADAAFRIASLAKADWNQLTEDRAREIFVDACPTDDSWTVRDVIKKWNSQARRAEPAEPPASDPLSGFGDAHTRVGAPTGAQAGVVGGGAVRAGSGSASGVTERTDGAVREAAGSDAGGAGGTGWRRYPLDEFGLAERVIALCGDRLRWSPETGRWYAYSGGAWQESKTGAEKAVQATVRRLPKLEAELYSEEIYQTKPRPKSERSDFYDWLKEQRTSARAKAVAAVIRHDGALDIDPAAVFDTEPLLLNAKNGVIDLHTGELLPHHPSQMLSRQLDIDYDPEAKADLWEEFLERVIPDAETRSYLQRVVGYSISGSTREQSIFIHQGPPASGKSVFLRVTDAMLGPFSRVVPPASLLTKRMEQHPTDIAGMEGRRMLQVSETPVGARLDEALIKRLSGEERITARLMGQDFRDFTMKGKVHIATNHLPHITADPALKRRLQFIPWSVVIPLEERNKKLGDTIIRWFLPGVLAWAVRGAIEWQSDGLKMPIESAAIIEEWMDTEDEFGEFIREELVTEDGAFMASKALFIRYAQWCESMRMKPMSKVEFGRQLAARGVPAARTMSERGWRVRLRYHVELADPLD